MTRILRKEIVKNKYIYMLIIPALIIYILFAYLPMYGIILAFKEYNFAKGITGSPWIGFENFKVLFADRDFIRAFKNTIFISFGRLAFEFPIPIIIALMLNELTKSKLKKFYQTVYTFPHFLSWVVVSGIMVNLLSSDGLVNQVLFMFGNQTPISFLTNENSFRALIFITHSWKEMGYGTIIYLAAIAGINPELYESAYIDGANRLQQIKSIILPLLKGTIIILLILNLGHVMNAGFDQILNLYNPAVYGVSDIIDTYVYRRTFMVGDSFGSSTAIGLFKSVINFMLLYGANTITKVMGEESLI